MTPGAAAPGAVERRTLASAGRERRRVLGVLIEKAKTTPDAYPMSVNALVTGANQKSNREPLLNLTDLDVEETLSRCQQQGLVVRITGGRVERWRHLLYELWGVNKVEIAILAELLLRGPQTEGELRGRAGRMEPIDDLETLKSVLRPLVQRKLVVYLTAEDRRGATLTHGFHDPRELERLKARAASEPAAAAPVAASPPRGEERPAPPTSGLADVRDEVAALEAKWLTYARRWQPCRMTYADYGKPCGA